MNLKKYIAEKLNIKEENLLNSPKVEMGDLCLPCFAFAKELKKSPVMIAEDFKQMLVNDEFIEKCEIVGGYLNIFFKTNEVGKKMLDSLKDFNLPQIGAGKTVCIDYCAVNLAKYLHIGHFATTIIGESLARIHEKLGYKVVRINYVGDLGTPFGKMYVGYKLWGNDKDIEDRGIDAVQELYVKFCANENEELMVEARKASADIEKKTGEAYDFYKRIIEITIDETKRLVGRMNIEFDDWRGESTYNDQLDKPLKEVQDANLSQVGEGGATIVDLNEYNLGVCVLKRSDDASLYITRDLCAVEDRYELYNFDKMLYVVACQQNNHFAKLIKICELLNKPYAKDMKHVSYGMFSLPEGKIASRKGKQALFADILDEIESEAFEAVKNRNLSQEQKLDISKKVAMSAIAFSVLKIERIKDKVFDIKKAVSFDGETGPYLQYVYARMNSLVKNYNTKYAEQIAKGNLTTEYPELNSDLFNLVKTLSNLQNVVLDCQEKYEPCLLARQLLDIAQLFNKYYNENKIITDDFIESTKKINLIKTIQNILKQLLPLVCISPVEEM